MTTIGSPCAKAVSASSIESKENAVRCGSSFTRTGYHGGGVGLIREGDVATGIVVCLSSTQIGADRTMPDQVAAVPPSVVFGTQNFGLFAFPPFPAPTLLDRTASRVSLDHHLDLRPFKISTMSHLASSGKWDARYASNFPSLSVGADCSARYLGPVPHDSSYYAKCMLGGLLACGVTHAGITPLDVAKCNMQVRRWIRFHRIRF